MSTDPHLPELLNTAAGRVDRVGEQLAGVATTVLITGIKAAFTWSGPGSKTFVTSNQAVATRLQRQIAQSAALSAVLRAAAASAAARIHAEQVAAEAQRRRQQVIAAQAAQAARAAAQAKQGGRR